MKISVFGLGYVGCISLACLAELGHMVIGVDINLEKVNKISLGKSTIIEKDVSELLEKALLKGSIEGTIDSTKAVLETDLSLIAVGTPIAKNGQLNMEYIYRVANEIAEALKQKSGFHVIVIRSTVLPGTNKKITEMLENVSGKKANVDFAVVSNPEFLREGTAVWDYYHPPYTLIGTSSEIARNMVFDLYKNINGEKLDVSIEIAEIIKFVNNSFHALKVAYANEIGNICKALSIDSHRLMDIFTMDKQLNISPAYLKPGFAYGGSCLPKDTAALKKIAIDHLVETPIISNIESSNDVQRKYAFELIESKNINKVGVLGLSFKEGTDDFRNSAIIDIVDRLYGRGYDIKIYDKNVVFSELIGTNKDFILNYYKHLQKILVNNIHDIIRDSDLIVVATREKEFADILCQYPGKCIVDLVRLWDIIEYDGEYDGLSWYTSHYNQD